MSGAKAGYYLCSGNVHQRFLRLAILEEFASKNLFNIMSKYNIFGMLPDIIANFFKTFVRVEENINC